MRKSILTIATISAWAMAIIYDRVEKITGAELNILLIGAVVTVVVGLYFGLCFNNKDGPKEEL